MTDTIDRIRTHQFFEGLEEAHIESLADCAHPTGFAAGTPLFREGEEARHFHLILSGSVALQTAAPDRAPATFQTLDSGDFVGVSWLVPPFRWGFDACAMSEVETIAFDAACLRGKCELDHGLGYALLMRFVPALVERLTSARLQALDLYGAPA